MALLLEDEHVVAVALDMAQPDADDLAESLLGWPVDRAGLVEQRRHELLADLAEQLVLGADVVVQAAGGEARRLDEVRNRRRVEPALCDHLRRARDDLLAALVIAGAQGGAGWRCRGVGQNTERMLEVLTITRYSPGMADMPSQVRIREVGPRDGFQNEPEVIATADKIALIDRLARTGVKRLEVTSFVRADVIPQLADAAEVLAGIDVPDDVSLSVLIPNERGLDNALELRDSFHEINVFLSASETHNRKNVNRSIAESLDGLERVVARAREAGLRCEGVISTSFGCPYEGAIEPARVLEIAAALRDFGCAEVGFGDTTGMANPLQVRSFFEGAFAVLGDVELTAHFHNTRGQGLANALAALEAGVTSFESSFGELGGCPVPAGATGNIATEDLVSMLHEMGIETGVSLDALLDAARAVREVLGRPLGSHTLVAGPVDWHA